MPSVPNVGKVAKRQNATLTPCEQKASDLHVYTIENVHQ